VDDALRRLEREAPAADTADAWSALATAFARAGRPVEASSAATRALGLGARDVRALVRPAALVRRVAGADGVTSVAWRGLRAPSAVRTVEVGAGSIHVVDAPLDLGQGRVVTSAAADAQVVAVDLVDGSVAWRAPLVHVAAADEGLVCLHAGDDEPIDLATHDPLTGAERGRGRVATSFPEVTALTHSALVLGRTLAWIGEPAPSLHRWDLVDHRPLGSTPLPRARRRLPDLLRAGDGLVAIGDGELVAYDERGAERWRAPRGRRESCLGVVDGRLLLEAPDGLPLQVLDLATGGRTPLAWGWETGRRPWTLLVTESVVALHDRGGQRIVALDRATLARRWETGCGGCDLLATADALLVLERERRGPTAVRALRSLDPTTGSTVAELPLGGVGGVDGAPTLAAGRLVLASNGRPDRAATLTIVEEAAR
jgi:hypothetical protein